VQGSPHFPARLMVLQRVINQPLPLHHTSSANQLHS
jgi:hypothetical protein